MEPSIYLDVLFLVQWGMHTLLLWMAGRILGYRQKAWRVLLGGLVPSLLHCGRIWMTQAYQVGILFSLVGMALGIWIAYTPRGLGGWIRFLGAIWVSSFLLGGALEMLFMRTQIQRYLGTGLVVRQRFLPWQYLLWVSLLAYIAIKGASKWLVAYVERRQDYCTLYIKKEDKEVILHGLIDTGNHLTKDGRGVVIATAHTICPLFSTEEAIGILSGERDGLEPLSYSSLGNQNGELWGFLAEECRMQIGEKAWTEKNLYIGIQFEVFAGAYEALVPAALIKEEVT